MQQTTKAFDYINELLKLTICRKDGDSCRLLNSEEKNIFIDKIGLLLSLESSRKTKILFRGTKRKIVQKRFENRLNSNDSLYDGLFLVGEKAKLYLNKEEELVHPITHINKTGKDVSRWIFNEFHQINYTKAIEQKYFEDFNNLCDFVSKTYSSQKILDYYLSMLHTYQSDFSLSFVSTTSDPQTAKDSEHGNDFVIVFWLPREYEVHKFCEQDLKNMNTVLTKKGLPIFDRQFKPEEKEYSIKGCIMPHFIIGVHDMINNRFVVNPGLFVDKLDWENDGFDVDNFSFREFITTTKYLRYVTLTNNIFTEGISND
jgi:hypothetical protein